jgi:hypothetical protein
MGIQIGQVNVSEQPDRPISAAALAVGFPPRFARRRPVMPGVGRHCRGHASADPKRSADGFRAPV